MKYFYTKISSRKFRKQKTFHIELIPQFHTLKITESNSDLKLNVQKNVNYISLEILGFLNLENLILQFLEEQGVNNMRVDNSIKNLVMLEIARLYLKKLQITRLQRTGGEVISFK